MLRTGWMALPSVLIFATSASAHVSEQGLVLLLPTKHYITSGVVSVVLSILLISLAPKRFTQRLFRAHPLRRGALPEAVPPVTSLFSLACFRWPVFSGLFSLDCFAALVAIGFAGPRDTLTKLLPLVIWTGLWITL